MYVYFYIHIVFPLHYFFLSSGINITTFLIYSVSFPSLKGGWQITPPRTGTADAQETGRDQISLVAWKLVQASSAANCNKYCLCTVGWCAASLCSSVQPLAAVKEMPGRHSLLLWTLRRRNPEHEASFSPPMPQCESEMMTLTFRSWVQHSVTLRETRARLYLTHHLPRSAFLWKALSWGKDRG